MKKCKFCSKEIKDNAQKCKHCGEWLNKEILKNDSDSEIMNCPFCGEKIINGAKKCRYCGKWLNDNEQQIRKESTHIQSKEYMNDDLFDNIREKTSFYAPFAIDLAQKFIPVVILVIIAIFIINIIKANDLPKCDSEFAEQQVIEIFKQNNSYFKGYKEENIPAPRVEFSMPNPISYDKEIKKYSCSGRITLYPTSGEYAVRSLYFDRQYESISCDVEYSIYKSKNRNAVLSTYCENLIY